MSCQVALLIFTSLTLPPPPPPSPTGHIFYWATELRSVIKRKQKRMKTMGNSVSLSSEIVLQRQTIFTMS